MRHVVLSVALLLTLAGLAVADGPETGVVSGRVTDAGGQPLPGVTVTIEGSQGSQTVITDESGLYRFALLRPGRYVVRATLEGFQGREAVANVSAGGKADIDLKLSLGTAEEITVTSEAPIVDKYNVSVGGSVEAETVAEVAAVNRGIYGSINMLPGVTNDQESLDLSSSRPSFNGTPWQESAVFIDGVDTTFTRYGATRMFVPSSATTEVSLRAGGSDAEYGRFVGGITNVVVKSGTNEYHGEAIALYRSFKWDANYKDHPELEQHPVRPRPADFFALTPEERDLDKVQGEASFGGPIVRDKAWFFVSAASFSTFTRDRTLNGDLIDQSSKFDSYIGKLNFQAGQSHSISASVIATPVERLFQLANFADPYVPTNHDIGGALATLNWNWSLNSKLFLETKVAHHTSSEDKKMWPCDCIEYDEALAVKQQDPRFAPIPGNNNPFMPVNNFDAYLDNADNAWHNGWLLDNGFGTNQYPRDQANLGLTQFAGRHELRYGIDWQETEWDQDVQRTNFFTGSGFDPYDPFGFDAPQAWLNYNPADVVAEGKGTGNAVGTNIGIYARDRFEAGDHFTFNLGLRVEDQNHENDIGRTVIDSTDISPRFTGVYDIKGDGKQLLTLSAGRYHTHIPQEMINSNLLDRWNGFNAHDRFFFIRAFGGYVFPIGGERPGEMWDLVDDGVIDIDIEPYGRDEVILGYEWQFSRSWAVKAKAIMWETFNQIGAGLTQLGPNGNLISFTENVEDLPNVMRGYGWVDAYVADCIALGRETPCTREVAEAALNSFEDAHREYNAIQLELNRRFRNGWALFTNVTVGKSEGNHFGSTFNNTSDSYGEQLHLLVTEADIVECQRRNDEVRGGALPDCEAAIRPFIGMPISVVNRFGDGEREKDLVAKAYGFKVFNIGKHTFNLGGLWTYETGSKWNYDQPGRETAATGGNTALDSSATLYVEPRGAREIGGRAWLNLSGAWGFPIAREVNGELRLEVTSVFNRQDLVGTGGDGIPNSNKRSWSQPRKFRMNFAIRF